MYFWIFQKDIHLYKDFYFACVNVCVYICTPQVYIVPTESGVTAGCKPSDMVLGTELGSSVRVNYLFSPNIYIV